MAKQAVNPEEIYALMWKCFEPFERGLKDPERKVALDSCIDAASRKLALSIETKPEALMIRCQNCLKVQPSIPGRNCDCGSSAFMFPV